MTDVIEPLAIIHVLVSIAILKSMTKHIRICIRISYVCVRVCVYILCVLHHIIYVGE